jgi:hypothetical protein
VNAAYCVGAWEGDFGIGKYGEGIGIWIGDTVVWFGFGLGLYGDGYKCLVNISVWVVVC